MKKTLNKYQRVGIDTNIFIYYFNRTSPFYALADQLISQITSKKLHMITSVLTLTELLSFKAPQHFIDLLEQELLFVPNLQMNEVTKAIAIEAAGIRREYRFRLADSIQLATAQEQKAEIFITNDQKLKQFKPLKILLLTELRL